MFVTREHAMGMYCPHSQKNCRADLCMAWRPITMYATWVEVPNAREATSHIHWSLQRAVAGEFWAVDCGYCGESGAPSYDVSVVAPVGYDVENLINLSTQGRRRTPRSFTRKEIEILRKQGKIPEHDDGIRMGRKAFEREKRMGKR